MSSRKNQGKKIESITGGRESFHDASAGRLLACGPVDGIEAEDTEAGQPLSPPVARALDEVVERILRESEALACMNFI